MSYDWTKSSRVPRNGLAAWYQYEPGVSANNLINDYSGNGRHVSCGAGNAPVLTANLLAGQPGWYFNGTRDPLQWSGSLNIRYAVVVGSFEDAAFSQYQGVVTGLTNGDVLLSNNSGTLIFFDSGSPQFDYRKNDVLYADNARQAPVSGSHSIMEMIMPGGIPMDGVQIGKDRNFTGRLLKGWIFEVLLFTIDPTELMRRFLFEYLAMRYWLWPRVADGKAVFPFVFNKQINREYGRETYLSEPYEGEPTGLIRGDFKSAYELPFNLRESHELLAAEEFFRSHQPLSKFVLRDFRHQPHRDTVVRFASPTMSEEGSNTTYRFNYSFDVIQTD